MKSEEISNIIEINVFQKYRHIAINQAQPTGHKAVAGMAIFQTAILSP